MPRVGLFVVALALLIFAIIGTNGMKNIGNSLKENVKSEIEESVNGPEDTPIESVINDLQGKLDEYNNGNKVEQELTATTTVPDEDTTETTTATDTTTVTTPPTSDTP